MVDMLYISSHDKSVITSLHLRSTFSSLIGFESGFARNSVTQRAVLSDIPLSSLLENWMGSPLGVAMVTLKADDVRVHACMNEAK